jgi:hypothetical protein
MRLISNIEKKIVGEKERWGNPKKIICKGWKVYPDLIHDGMTDSGYYPQGWTESKREPSWLSKAVQLFITHSKMFWDGF